MDFKQLPDLRLFLKPLESSWREYTSKAVLATESMFKVVTRDFSQEFVRWTDALNTAKSLQPQCKSLLQDIRIFEGDDLVWIYSRSHTYPQFVGPGTYKRLALRFLQEAIDNGEAWAMGEASETDHE